MTELQDLTAISPIDGRYRDKTGDLPDFFSEAALMKYRLKVEIEYFIALCEQPIPQLRYFDKVHYHALRDIYSNFLIVDAKRIKEIERTTNHDVKAVEYFLKNKFDVLGLSKFKEFIHFGLTSQDINNTALPLLLKDAIYKSYYPLMHQLADKMRQLSQQWKDITMIARTHGQPASPTRMGKEINVFVERIKKQLELMQKVPYSAKFGGATGNFNAHLVAYPNINWIEFANNFLKNSFALERQQTTTQIEHYDLLAALFDNLKRLNTILIDLCRDFWMYIAFDYFKQKIIKGEVGSSTMPHKVNPIDFENAEGNFGIANAMFGYLSSKLPISRMQRDLTDSTVSRNVGVPLAHTVIAMRSVLKGLGKLIINKETIDEDINKNWSVVAEAIQTILRREGVENPYEMLKDLTRKNDVINQQAIYDFIDSLNINTHIKEELKQITPWNYTGY